MKRGFGLGEVIFDIAYLLAGAVIGIILIFTRGGEMVHVVAGIMALVLVCGDSFHLVPRIRTVISNGRGDSKKLQVALGRGKMITSITMTLFYLLLWQLGELIYGIKAPTIWTASVYILGVVRIALCVMPQNKWLEQNPPKTWGIWRNIPFFAMGLVIAMYFLSIREGMGSLGWMWLAIILSFAFYAPVVLWSDKNPKIGMLMIPKTMVYVWMLVMCLNI